MEIKKVKGAKLKGLRAEYGLSQSKMAEKLGISTLTYLERENEPQKFKVSELRKIKEIFNLDSVEDIFFE